MTDIATATPRQCNANATGRAATEWGEHALPCQTTRGLRTFTDRQGLVRAFCAAPGHEANAKRRFGEPLAEEQRVSLAIERITGEFAAYMGEDDEEPDFDREGQPEFNGSFR